MGLMGLGKGKKRIASLDDYDPEDGHPNAITFRSDDFVEWMDRNMEWLLDKTRMKAIAGDIAKEIFNWGTKWSIYPLHMGIKCCALEMAATGCPRFDSERFGIIFRSSPRQCDVLLVNGPSNEKLMPMLLRLYEMMPEPKWVIAMGECAISGGPFYQSYAVVNGVDHFMPVDVYIPGCPASPKALIDAMLKLQYRIVQEKDMRVVEKGRNFMKRGTEHLGGGT